MSSQANGFSSWAERGPLRLTEDHQTRPAQTDEGPFKPAYVVLSHLKSNMTPNVVIYSFFFIRAFITNGQVSQ